MSYFSAKFFLKLPLLILVPYLFLFCIPMFSQAGGRVNDDDKWVRIRPAGPEISKGIPDQEIEARQAPGESGNSKRNQRRGSPYQRPSSVEHSTGSNEASAQKEGEFGLKRAFQPSNATGSEQPQQEVMVVQAGSPTPNHGYENKGALPLKRGHAELKAAPDGSFIAGIENGKVVIYVPPQSENEKWSISPQHMPANTLAISEDSLSMATAMRWCVSVWRKGDMPSQWVEVDRFPSRKTTAIKFSQRGHYAIATEISGSLFASNQRGKRCLVTSWSELFAINEQDDIIVTALPGYYKLGMTLSYRSRLTAEGSFQTHFKEQISPVLQNLYLSPDGQMILGLNKNTQWVWRISDDRTTMGLGHTSQSFRCVNMSEDDVSLGNRDVADVFIDNKSVIIIRISEGRVELSRITRKGETGHNFVHTDFELHGYNYVKATNAFYIPNGDRIAVIYADGSMRMWQDIARKGDAQKPSVVLGFGKVLHYNGPGNCFLVKDCSGRVIVRHWCEQ